MTVNFAVFRKITMTQAKAMRQWRAKAEGAMRRVGAVIMRDAQKKIKRRIVTNNMRSRLAAARARGDNKAAGRIMATIYLRQQATSKPGQPPIAHVPDRPYASIRDIRFHATQLSVLVGPSGGHKKILVKSNRVTVPQLLEEGGRAGIEEISSDRARKVWLRRDRRRGVRPWQRTRTRIASYAKRPFMKPALVQSFPKQRQIIASAFGR